MNQKTRSSISILFLSMTALLLSSVSFAAHEAESKASLTWLAVVDSGNYESSWQNAAPFFQSKISSEKWVQALELVRSPLGKLSSRELKEAKAYAALPGVPDGEYVVMSFASAYEKLEAATETLTLSKVGAEWLVVGYFIQ